MDITFRHFVYRIGFAWRKWSWPIGGYKCGPYLDGHRTEIKARGSAEGRVENTNWFFPKIRELAVCSNWRCSVLFVSSTLAASLRLLQSTGDLWRVVNRAVDSVHWIWDTSDIRCACRYGNCVLSPGKCSITEVISLKLLDKSFENINLSWWRKHMQLLKRYMPVTGKGFPLQTLRGSRGIAPLILNLGSRWRPAYHR